MKNTKYTETSLMKESKQISHAKYFESNWNNIRNTWKGIKTIISVKNVTTTIQSDILFTIWLLTKTLDYPCFD